ncbi:MAG: M56 family metallopeptidase [Muribaculaceae bacterium]|nr:M56 family metallopeptidase [Muribaculaceae bacterium]
MGELFSYSLGVSVFLLFGYLAYKLFLSGEKQPLINRVTLLSIYIISMVALPLLAMEWSSAEPVVRGTIDLGSITVSVVPSEVEPASMVLPRMLLACYVGGVVVSALISVVAMVRIAVLLHRGTCEIREGFTLVTLPDCDVPFSFGRYIFIGEGETSEAQSLIEAHEEAHLRHLHWLDLVLAQVMCVVMWYNPVVWLMREELRQVHEYQADASVLSKGYDPYVYQMLLIKKAAGRRLQSLANSLNHSNLSKRITMMYKSENRGMRTIRVLALLPAIALAVLAVEQPAVARTISQAGSASLLPVGVVEETVVADKVTENYADNQELTENDILPTDQEDVVAESSDAMAPVTGALDDGVELKENLPDVSDYPVKIMKKMPQFPGGERAMMEFLVANMKYPEDAAKAGKEGRVIVNFTVEKDGSVSDPSIVRGICESLDAEALRVVGLLPKFEPGIMEDGEPVACVYTLPVSFKLKKDEAKAKVVEHYAGNLTIHTDSSKPHPACFVNGKPYDGDFKDIPSESIAEITLTKNDPAYPDGKMEITLKD